METGSYQKLSGEIEADQTFIGGLAKNMHKKVREAKIKGRGPQDKTAVMGVLQRDGEVRAFVVPDRKKPTVQVKIRENVTPGSEVFTDALRSYEGLTPEYAHEAVDHAECYVRGNVHTNGLENFWSLLKRTLGGPTSLWPRSTFTATSTSRSSATTPARERTAAGSSPSRREQSAVA